MSTVPLGGVVGSVAGAPLAQTTGASAERIARDTVAKETTDELDLHAENSAGIGATEEEHGSADRDADGRLPWQWPQRKPAPPIPEEEAPPPNKPDGEHQLDLIA